MLQRTAILLFAVCLLGACSQDDSNTSSTDSGDLTDDAGETSADDGDAGETSSGDDVGETSADDGDAGETSSADTKSQEFQGCGLLEPCAKLGAFGATTGATGDLPDDAICFLNQLATAETAKLIVYIDNGDSWSGTDVFIGYPDRKAVYINKGFNNGEPTGWEGKPESCVLKAAEYFNECVKNNDWDCLESDNWFENCDAEANPVCPE
jgi:hypothetical protein